MQINFKWSLFLVSVLLGGMMTVQFSTVRHQAKVAEVSTVDSVQLTTDLMQAKERRMFLYNEINNLQAQIEKYKNKKGDTDEFVKEMAEELEKIKRQAGVSDVKGDGLVITITNDPEAAAMFPPEDQHYNSMVFGLWLYATVNYLNGNEAQAISINDHRITSLSSIRSVGESNLQVNTKMIYPDKVVIKAIGNIDQMKVALYGFELIPTFKGIGKNVEIREVTDGTLLVPKYEEEVRFHYAKPEGDKSL